MSDIVSYFPLIGSGLGLVCLWKTMKCNRRRRLLQDTPTSKTNGVFIGFVELKGTAETESPFVSYLANAPCVYYTWNVSEHWSKIVTEHYTDSQGRSQTRVRRESGWTTVASGGKSRPFYLEDDTGLILVNPEGAELELSSIFSHTCGRADPLYYEKGPMGAIAHSDHRRRFTENAILLHHPVYICGHARLREDVVAPEIAQHRDAPLFIISVRDEKEICSSYAWSTYGWWIAGVVFWGGGWGLSAGIRGGGFEDYASWVPPVSVATGVFVLLTVLAWVWMVFDSLVRLRQRVYQGWSLIDVQLKRRHDLIPGLLNIVKGYSAHEARVQTTIAEMRAQFSPADADKAAPVLRPLAGSVMALAEAYPDLKADSTFLKFQDELTDTENRIALARGYFNEIATYYNSRIQVLPERFVASATGMKPHPLLEARDFERARVDVNLSE